MSELLALRNRLQETSSAITHLERSLAQNPDSPVVQFNLESVVRRFEQLESEFVGLADRKALDVCAYRLFTDEPEGPSIRGFSGALHEFQASFSSLYDAIKNGRRLRTVLTPDVDAATRFNFGYAYSGSVGVVLTISKERLLLGGNLLDDTVATFFRLAKAPTHDEIKTIGRELGPAPLKAIHRWAKAHISDGLGADIKWREGREVKASLFMQRAEIDRLRAEIEATSDEDHEKFPLTGYLTGASIENKRFDFRPDGLAPISGRFTDAISAEYEVSMPNTRYRALVEKVTKVVYSSEQDIVAWHLLKLEKLEG